MEYIIFLVTIQGPFLYLIWKTYQKHSGELKENIRHLKKQNEHIANFMDTLRMSLEKISEDIYGKGEVNARFFQIEKNLKDLKKSFRDIEVYTGLNPANQSLEELSSTPSLKDKDFI